MNTTDDIRSFFNLSALPFTREIAVKDRWRHPIFDEPFGAFKRVFYERMSGCLEAPSGMGKTLLLRSLQEEALPEARFRVQYMAITGLSKRDFCREVARVLGCPPVGTYPALVHRIQEKCLTLTEQESLRPVLIIDEAHDLRPEVLSILRILTNFEMDSRLVLSLLIAGQSGLKALLRRDELEAISRRMTHFDTIRPLSREETREYILHRLRIVGAQDELFDTSAYDGIYECSQGNLRAINRLCLKSLQMAAQKGNKVVGTQHVVQARQKLLP